MEHKERAEQRFGEVENDLRELSQWMYDNPEIAFEEHESATRLSRFLADGGMEVEFPAYGLETAFVARSGSTGPEVVICAEYDALPGVGHACGHNLIATAALGAGLALAPLAEDLGCRVTVLGTPAEEQYGGKVDLIGAGAFSDAAAAMMIHPSPFDIVDPAMFAVAHLDVHFRGKESHASFAPHLGVNALDAFVQAYVNVATLRQQLLSSDKVHCIVTHGGDAANIIPVIDKLDLVCAGPRTQTPRRGDGEGAGMLRGGGAGHRVHRRDRAHRPRVRQPAEQPSAG